MDILHFYCAPKRNSFPRWCIWIIPSLIAVLSVSLLTNILLLLKIRCLHQDRDSPIISVSPPDPFETSFSLLKTSATEPLKHSHPSTQLSLTAEVHKSYISIDPFDDIQLDDRVAPRSEVLFKRDHRQNQEAGSSTYILAKHPEAEYVPLSQVCTVPSIDVLSASRATGQNSLFPPVFGFLTSFHRGLYRRIRVSLPHHFRMPNIMRRSRSRSGHVMRYRQKEVRFLVRNYHEFSHYILGRVDLRLSAGVL